MIDRTWPRGLTKERLLLDAWYPELAPTSDLNRWFGNRAERWDGFRRRYREELKGPGPTARLRELIEHARHGVVTVVFATPQTDHTPAAALLAYLEECLALGRDNAD